MQIAPHWGGGRGWVRVSQIQKSWEAVKWLDRLAPHLAHICRSIWEWIYAKQIAHRDTRGAHGGGGGVRGQTFKSLGKLPNGWTDWHQLWFTSADSSENGYRLNASLPSITQVFFWGYWVTHSKVWGICQTAAPIGTEFGTRRRIRLGMDIG